MKQISNLTLNGVSIHVFVSYLLCGSLPGTSHLWRPAVWSCNMPIHLSLLMGLAAPSRSFTCHMAPCWGLLPLVAQCSHFRNCVVPAWNWLLSGPSACCLAPLQGLAAFYLNHYKETTRKGSRKNNKASEKKSIWSLKRAVAALVDNSIHSCIDSCFCGAWRDKRPAPHKKSKIPYFNKIMF